MPESVVAVAPLWVKVKSLIVAAGVSAEIGQPPRPSTSGAAMPERYVILYSIVGGSFVETMEESHGAGTAKMQATSVGLSAHQAATTADIVRTVILGMTNSTWTRSLDVATTPALKVGGRWSDGPGGVDHEGKLFQVAEIYGFLVTAA